MGFGLAWRAEAALPLTVTVLVAQGGGPRTDCQLAPRGRMATFGFHAMTAAAEPPRPYMFPGALREAVLTISGLFALRSLARAQ